VVWLAAATLLAVLVVATAAHWLHFPERARTHHRHPVMAHFYGAPPMALMTVGAGAMLVGNRVLGDQVALGVDWVLWTVGTVLGLGTAVMIPALAFTGQRGADDAAFGGWLMPVVPPMVSAATGAILVEHLPAGEARATMLGALYAMAGISFVAAVMVIAQIWSRLMRHSVGPAVMVPTLWIVLGPLGQGVTAVNVLAAHAAGAVGAGWVHVLHDVGIVVGVPVLGFAGLWAAIAGAVTVRQVRAGMPFALTWWSFTFPIGTCATGAASLAAATGSSALAVLAWVAFAGLVVAWGVVAVRTFHGAVIRGTLLA
jgi:tellurite resistance protein TehA-like permease